MRRATSATQPEREEMAGRPALCNGMSRRFVEWSGLLLIRHVRNAHSIMQPRVEADKRREQIARDRGADNRLLPECRAGAGVLWLMERFVTAFPTMPTANGPAIRGPAGRWNCGKRCVAGLRNEVAAM